MAIRSPAEVVRSRRFMQILDAVPIDHAWWKRVSAGAKSGLPHHKTMMDLHLNDFIQQVADEQGFDDGEARAARLPEIPGDLDGVSDDDVPISQDEALAIISRFLVAERGELAKGAELYVLEWLVLCGIHCPRRERYAALREFVNIGYLREKDGAIEYADSDLKWPLIVLPPCIDAVEKLLYVRRYVPDLYSISRRGALLVQTVPLLRSIVNTGARLLLPRM
jgi:hypothetical protein